MAHGASRAVGHRMLHPNTNASMTSILPPRGAVAIALAACVALAGCTASDTRDRGADPDAQSLVATAVAADTSYRQRPGYVVDSILPVEEELRRFRDGLGPVPAAFEGGATSRQELVRRFFRALAAADTVALERMRLTRAEFAWLVYPSSPYTHPPYRQSPAFVWMQLDHESGIGLRRLLGRAREYRYLSHRCAPEPEIEGRNRLWRQCRARAVRAPGDTVDTRLFGVVVERDGRFKFASYESDF
jgi:hypothetical protein